MKTETHDEAVKIEELKKELANHVPGTPTSDKVKALVTELAAVWGT